MTGHKKEMKWYLLKIKNFFLLGYDNPITIKLVVKMLIVEIITGPP